MSINIHYILGRIKLIIRSSDTFLTKLTREGGFLFFSFFFSQIYTEWGWGPGGGVEGVAVKDVTHVKVQGTLWFMACCKIRS